jgi:hypothetical protein
VIASASVAAVERARRAGGVRPVEDWSFARLPATVARLLTGAPGGLPEAALGALGQRWARVALVLLDGFGWRYLERWADRHPFLRRIEAEGVVAKLTSQFPSTTTAHVTTIHSGLPVGEHGLYEWNVYEPLVDAIVTPLLFSRAGEQERDTLARDGIDPRAMLPAETLYRRLATAGVRPVAFSPARFSPSTFDGVALAGAELQTYEQPQEGFARAAAALRGGSAPVYVYLYSDAIDFAAHAGGPDSDRVEAAIGAALDALEAAFGRGGGEPALLLLCADHGETAVDPARTDYVDDAWPAIGDLLRRGAGGRPLAPAGAARDLFLHAAPGRADELADGLAARLAGGAEVHAVPDLVAQGLFGASVGARLRARLGDVCVLPAPGRMAWLRAAAGMERWVRGHHGGLSIDEAETFVAALGV